MDTHTGIVPHVEVRSDFRVVARTGHKENARRMICITNFEEGHDTTSRPNEGKIDNNTVVRDGNKTCHVWLHTFGQRFNYNQTNPMMRSYIDTRRISQFKLDLVTNASISHEVPAEVVAVTSSGGKHVLTPRKMVLTREDVNRLTTIIPQIIHTVNTAHDGAIIRAYSDDEKEWAIVEEMTSR